MFDALNERRLYTLTILKPQGLRQTESSLHHSSERAYILQSSQNLTFKVIEYASIDNIRNCGYVTNFVKFFPIL